MVKDGLAGLSAAIEYLSSQNNMFKYYKVHKLLGQGNFVLGASRRRMEPKTLRILRPLQSKGG